MSCTLIDGNKIASELYGGIRERIATLKVKGYSLCLAFILLGNNPSSEIYAKMKYKKCVELGISSMTFRLPEDTTEEMLLKKIDELNVNSNVQGILVQLPLPKHIDENRVINAINPMKDVDCLHPHNVGRILIGNPIILPATPAGIQQLLIRSGVETSGKRVVILGRSNIVGKPLAAMLMQEGKGANSTVTVVHSMTKNLIDITNQADILVSSLGKPRSITADMIKEGAVVIDVGITRVSDPSNSKNTKLLGDVEIESVMKKASVLTPVPGGVGPMTVCMLMNNMVTVVEHQLGCF